MNKDMLARIKSRSQRPKVERDTSFGPPPPVLPDVEDEVPAAEPEAAEPEAPAAPAPTKATAASQAAPSIEAQLEQLIQVAPRRNIRLEESLDKDIERFVQEQDLTIETLLEACYLALKEDPQLQHRVVAQAAARLAERKEAGKLRRVYSQMQKLKG